MDLVGRQCLAMGYIGINFNEEGPFGGHHLGGDSCPTMTFEGVWPHWRQKQTKHMSERGSRKTSQERGVFCGEIDWNRSHETNGLKKGV